MTQHHRGAAHGRPIQEQQTMNTTQVRHAWYATRANSNGHGFVIDEATGRNVAVAYDSADAPLLAAAPELLEACKLAVDHFNTTDATHDRTGRRVGCTAVRDAIRAAIAKAE